MFGTFIENIGNTQFIVDMIICILFIVAISTILIYQFRKILAIYVIVGCFALGAICFIFGFELTAIILFSLFVVLTTVFSLANISEIRGYFIKPQSKKKKESPKYNKEVLYRVIDDTVHSLSRTKTGGIMTFERATNLDDVIKNGTIVNAPVSQELLETIFYEGTRLHDGAVVIRDNMIIAASVYYTPTTRALTGKYGSRHRAAFGISEISDSITVVVSEETGRVSIAHNGSLESVSLDDFLREFSDLMSTGE